METRQINGETLTLDETVNKNKQLIWSVVKRHKSRGAAMGIDPHELFSIAGMGMIKAFKNFDPENFPVKFSTYAVPMMNGEIQRYFRDNSGDLKFSRSILDVANKILREQMQEEEISTIALHFDITEEEVKTAFEYFRLRKAQSMEATVYHSDGDDITLADQIGNEKLSDYTQVTVDSFLDTLDDRERTIIELTMQEWTQREIGDHIGLSQVQVSRIIKQLHPAVERFFGFPVGYFSNREGKKSKKKERVVLAKKKTEKRKVKGDLELAKKLLAETKRTPCSIAKETNCTDAACYYWAKKIREPEKEENPVTTSKIEPIVPDETEGKIKEHQEHIDKVLQEFKESLGVPAELVGGDSGSVPQAKANVEMNQEGIFVDGNKIAGDGNYILGVPNGSSAELESKKAKEEAMKDETEAVKKAEEHRQKLISNAQVVFGYSITSKDVTPSDLHTLFTQAGHSAASSGVEKVNLQLVITTGELEEQG